MQIFGHFYQFVWADLWTLGQNRGQDLLLIVSGWVENIGMPTRKPEKKEPKKPLSVTHPELAKEAYGWDPDLITAGTGKKLTWNCSLNHRWETTPAHRIRGQGCPFCGNRRILIGFNDLATTHPHLVSEIDGWDPKTVSAGSHKTVGWKCNKGHQWTVAIEYRAKQGTNCPACAGKAVAKGFNDLSTTHPQIAKEAFGWNPETVTQSSGKKLRWKCLSGHIYEAAVYSRTGKSASSCPFCSNRKIAKGENDLATTHPQIASEADGWDPTTVSAGVGRKKYGWVCLAGHAYKSYVYSRTSGAGCPVCANLSIEVGTNDLASTHPDLALEADGWDPTVYVAGSSQKVKWICKLKHSYSASIVSRAKKETSCPICANKIVLRGFNDLATTHPQIAHQAAGWNPSEVTGGTHKKLDWKCEKGHIWTAIVNTRIRGNNCPICSNQITRKGVNDLSTTYPDIAAQAFGWDPSTMNAGSHIKKDWICSQGHIWDAAIFTRMRGKGYGCPICSNHRLLIGFNDLATKYPALLSEVDGWDASKFLSGTKTKMAWKCAAGHKWKTSINSRTGSKKSGCPTCAKYGYDINSDGFLYFLEHQSWNMFQVGITNVPDGRLKQHKKLGWEVLEIRGPMDGLLTQQWETAILQMLKKKGADLSNEKIAGKFDGYSEAWSKSTFEVGSIKELMRLTEEFEDGLKSAN